MNVGILIIEAGHTCLVWATHPDKTLTQGISAYFSFSHDLSPPFHPQSLPTNFSLNCCTSWWDVEKGKIKYNLRISPISDYDMTRQ